MIAQEIRQNVAVEGHRYVLIGLSSGNAVVGHNDAHIVLNRCDEGDQVVVKVVARVNLTLTRLEMGIQTIELRTAAWEMLHHGHDALVAKAIALKALHVSNGHLS